MRHFAQEGRVGRGTSFTPHVVVAIKLMTTIVHVLMPAARHPIGDANLGLLPNGQNGTASTVNTYRRFTRSLAVNWPSFAGVIIAVLGPEATISQRCACAETHV